MNTFIEDHLRLISTEIESLPLAGEPTGLYEPVAYCLRNGGKRIRPLMTLLACDMFDGDMKLAIPPAIGLELFHNFTLMHDDIMDNAPVRRNQPTVHKKWSPNTAILSGDVLFALACRYVGMVPDSVLRPVMDIYHQTVIEVCEGQQYDMDFESKQAVRVEEYLEMIRLKTAVLPAACLQIGAIVAGANDDDSRNIYGFGELLGLAFQLRDDWLDVFGDREAFGKQTGGDIIANKKTWLYIHALSLANTAQKTLLLDAFSGKIHDDQEKVNLVKGVYHDLDIHHMALDAMRAYYDKAMERLTLINAPHNRKEHLIVLADMLMKREK